MAVCTACTVSALVVPVPGGRGQCRRLQASGVDVAPWLRGCDYPASSSAAASPPGMRKSLALRTGACGSSRRSVVCEMAVTIGEGEKAEATSGINPGSRIRVKGPLTVYHVMKSPNLEIQGMEGEVKEVLGIHNGKKISATFPIKAQFSIDLYGKPVKFVCHFKPEEVELVE